MHTNINTMKEEKHNYMQDECNGCGATGGGSSDGCGATGGVGKGERTVPGRLTPGNKGYNARRAVMPSMKRRARWHSYSMPGTYMVTMAVEGLRPVLGRLATVPGPHVVLSPLGEAVSRVIWRTNAFYPQVEVWKVCIMPDHVHVIMRVTQQMPVGKSLGTVVNGIKHGCNRECCRLGHEAAGGNGSKGLFEEGYNDRLLFDGGAAGEVEALSGRQSHAAGYEEDASRPVHRAV